MADVTIPNSPFHTTAQITYPYGEIDSGYSCGFHTGVDIVSRDNDNKIIYPCFGGTVVYTNNTTNVALGVQCQIRDDVGRYWRYCHMQLNSLNVRVGDRVLTDTPIGIMGSTGNVRGAHLHLECSNVQAWQCNQFVNPCDVLGIPNVDDLIIYWNASSPPNPDPPPDPVPVPQTFRERTFPWYIYSRNLRRK